MGVHSAMEKVCDRKQMIKNIKLLLNDMENTNVEARCCCTDPNKPPAGTRVVRPQVLDGKEAVPQLVPQNKDKYLWIPPDIDNRPLLSRSDACYSATVNNEFYDEARGCSLTCDDVVEGERGGTAPHSHWWNASTPTQGRGAPPSRTRKGMGLGPDYCENPNFVPPEPAGHMAWTNEPGGTCKHPQYCKAHCFEHTPEKDWARHY